MALPIEKDRFRHCPFCGGARQRVLLMKDDLKQWVYCRVCGASGPLADNTQDAINRWNESGSGEHKVEHHA
jgi:Lar family restriction alleviation protein